MFKELIKYLPELIYSFNEPALINIARMMSDLGYIKVPSWMLSIDVPNISLLLILIILILKNARRKRCLKKYELTKKELQEIEGGVAPIMVAIGFRKSSSSII